jgi:hypothetical protein
VDEVEGSKAELNDEKWSYEERRLKLGIEMYELPYLQDKPSEILKIE